jgi:hypothetical protein
MAGYAYRLVDVPSDGRKKSLMAFKAWLQDEAAAFRQRSSPAIAVPKAA